MKKIVLIILFYLVWLSYLSAKDYNTIIPGRISYFSSEDGNVKCIRIDSIKYITDSIYYFSKNIQQIDDYCFSPYGSSWIGKKAIARKGYNLFFNRYNDTIFIKTNAVVNEKWTVYNNSDSLFIIGQVIKIDTISFLGINDSVKTISFSAYDKSMKPLTIGLNNMSVILSKNYGFIKTLNFLLFPDYELSIFQEFLKNYSLVGLTKPNIGVQNLTWLDVNDFKVYDEIHIYFESSSWEGGNKYGSSTTQKTIYKYLNRIDFKDSIKYFIDREQSTFRRIVRWDSTSYQYIHDTIISVFKTDSIFDKFPDEPIIDSYSAYSQSMSNSINISKTSPSNYGYLYHTIDSCWQMIIADGCIYSSQYLKGLGGPYYSCTNAFSLGGEDRELVYYKKGNESWGKPLIISGIESVPSKSIIELYPNPTDELLWLKSDFIYLPYSFELYDLRGQLLYENEVTSNLKSINLSDFNNGLYIYKIVCNNRLIKTGKLIKNNTSR